MSNEDELFKQLTSGIKSNWDERTKVYESLRVMNYTSWYLHELIETLEDPDDEVEDSIMDAVKMAEESCQNLIDLIEAEYELDDDEEDEDE